jgi:hypothetical protein
MLYEDYALVHVLAAKVYGVMRLLLQTYCTIIHYCTIINFLYAEHTRMLTSYSMHSDVATAIAIIDILYICNIHS